MDIPQTVEALDAGYLTVALHEASGGGTVTSVRADDIGTGVGVFGIIARLHLTWQGAAAHAPSTVIAKMPTAAEANRMVGLALGLYEREHRFYAEAAQSVPFPVPACYHNVGSAADTVYLLLLEDLAGLEMGDQLTGLSQARAISIVEQMAAFHASWWDTDALDELSWLPSQNDPVYLAAVPPIVSAGVAALGPLEASLPPGSLELAARVDAAFVDLTDACAKGPRTFVHGDLRLDNLFFTPGTDACTLIDWQLSLRARGVADVVWLLATSMDPEVQDQAWGAVLDVYRAALATHGIVVDPAELQRAAAEHAGYLLSGPLSLVGTFDFSEAGDGRAAALTKKWVARGFNLALRLGTGDVIA